MITEKILGCLFQYICPKSVLKLFNTENIFVLLLARGLSLKLTVRHLSVFNNPTITAKHPDRLALFVCTHFPSRNGKSDLCVWFFILSFKLLKITNGGRTVSFSVFTGYFVYFLPYWELGHNFEP